MGEDMPVDRAMPEHLVPIGNGPYYWSPVEPVDPWDCDRWANSAACDPIGGVTREFRPGLDFDFSSSNLSQLLPYIRDSFTGDATEVPIIDACVSVSPSIAFFNLPPLDVCFTTAPLPEPPRIPTEPQGGVDPLAPPLAPEDFPTSNPGICRSKVVAVWFRRRRDSQGNRYFEPVTWDVNVIGVASGAYVSYGATNKLTGNPNFPTDEWTLNVSVIPPDPLTLAYPQAYIDYKNATEGAGWATTASDGSYYPTAPDAPPARVIANYFIPGCVTTSFYYRRPPDAENRRVIHHYFCGQCGAPPSRRTNPPTIIYPRMSCCPENEELLRRIAVRIGVGRRENDDRYPIEVPADITGTTEETLEIETIPDFLAWQFKQLDALMGQFPSKIQVKTFDENGDPTTQDVELQNISETLSELFGMLYTTMYSADENQHILYRLVSELLATKNAALIAGDIAFANSEYLGYKMSRKKKPIASAFDIRQTTDSQKFLNNGQYDLQSWINADDNTAIDVSQKLLYAASIIKAVFHRKGNLADSDLLNDLFSTFPDGAVTDEAWETFVRGVEYPEGRAGGTIPYRTDIDDVEAP